MILAWLSAAFVLGVVLGVVLPAAPAVAILVACLLIISAFLGRRRRRWWGAALVCAAVLLGVARAPHAGAAPSPHDLSYYNGSFVQLHGRVAAEPDVRDRGINYVVAVDQVIIAGRATAVSGRVQVHTPRAQQLDYADAVSLQGRLIEPRNTSSLPYREILAQRGIGSEMSFPRVVDLGPTSPDWLGWLVLLRQRLERGINAWLPEPEAALLIAITLGAKSASLGDVAPVLVATGLIHIVAISGIKVALVAGTLYELSGLARQRIVALLVPLLGLILYVLLTGSTASGERSAAMWALVFIAAYLGRGTVALVSLSFVAGIMVAFAPSLLWDIGFQMSTVGTFSIVAFAAPLGRVLRLLPSPLREAFCVTVAAQIGTLPIVAVGFHMVSFVGPIANALVLPLLPVLIVLGFILGACSGIAALAALVGSFAYALLHDVISLSAWLTSFPGALPSPVVSPVFAALYYIALAFLALEALRRVHWAPLGEWASRSRELSLVLVLGASTLTAALVPMAHQDGRLYWLGSGDAILLRSGGMTVLVDGSSKPFTLLERLGAVLPYQVRTIDLVVVTDPRAANIAGLQAVLDHYEVSEVLDGGAEYPSTTYAQWREELRQRDIPVYALRAGISVQLGDVGLSALGPDGLYPNPKDCIGMLRLSIHHRTVLLAGAASPREQLEAVFRPVQLRADVLVLGGKGQYVPAFLRAVRPDTVLTVGGRVQNMHTLQLPADRPFSAQL